MNHQFKQKTNILLHLVFFIASLFTLANSMERKQLLCPLLKFFLAGMNTVALCASHLKLRTIFLVNMSSVLVGTFRTCLNHYVFLWHKVRFKFLLPNMIIEISKMNCDTTLSSNCSIATAVRMLVKYFFSSLISKVYFS